MRKWELPGSKELSQNSSEQVLLLLKVTEFSVVKALQAALAGFSEAPSLGVVTPQPPLKDRPQSSERKQQLNHHG